MSRFHRGDYIKVEFESEVQGLAGEWMWVRVHHCDDERQVVFGTLDNEPVVNSDDLQLGGNWPSTTLRFANTRNRGSFTRTDEANPKSFD